MIFCPNGPSQVVSLVASTPLTVPLTNVTETSALRLSSSLNARYFIAFGDDTVVATTSDLSMLAQTEVFKVPTSATHLSLISLSNLAAVYLTEGQSI